MYQRDRCGGSHLREDRIGLRHCGEREVRRRCHRLSFQIDEDLDRACAGKPKPPGFRSRLWLG